MNNTTLNTLNNILNEWANKFGTTVEKLIPEMQKYYITQYAVTVIAWLIILIVMLCIGKFLIKKHNEIEKESTDYDELHVWGYVCLTFSIIPFVVVCYFTTILFQWIVSPSAALVNKIIQTISGNS